VETASNGVLRFVGINGERPAWTVHFGAETAADGSGLPARLLTADDGRVLAVQKWVPADLPSRLPAAYDLLENEIRAGTRLIRRYGRSYPVELARLVGYDVDAEQPFVLVTQPRGEPLDTVAGQLLLAEQRAFEASLFRALLLLAGADLVHGNLTPQTVRWDGTAVQVRDFGHATVCGEPRVGHEGGVWSPAEQRTGTGAAAPADDVWAGGMLLYHVVTGRRPSVRTGPPNLADRGAALRSVLDGVFAETADGRPDAAEILRRMRADTALPPGSAGTDAVFEEGGRRFDEVRRSKLPPPVQAAHPPPRSSRQRSRALALTAATLLVVIVAVAAAVVLTVWRP
jgi:hypothetical protein